MVGSLYQERRHLFLRRLLYRQNTRSQQIKVRPTVHRAFHRIQGVDLRFDLPIALFRTQRRLNICMVLTQTSSEVLEFGNRAEARFFQPAIQGDVSEPMGQRNETNTWLVRSENAVGNRNIMP